MPPKLKPPPPPDFEDEATLYSLSSEFFEAATLLSNTPPTQTGYSLVTYYLAGHAAELMLKSLLFRQGESIRDLANGYGHNLESLVSRARLKGLPLAVSTENIQSLACAYARKRAEYRQKHPLTLPSLDLLLQEIKSLQSHVFDNVAGI